MSRFEIPEVKRAPGFFTMAKTIWKCECEKHRAKGIPQRWQRRLDTLAMIVAVALRPRWIFRVRELRESLARTRAAKN